MKNTPAFLLLCFFFLVRPPLHAQDFPFPEGVYMSIHELAVQQPTRKYNLTITERTPNDISMNGGNDYRVESADEMVKKRFIKENIWGISDGETLYLNGDKFDCQPWFTKVEHVGRVLVYKGGIRKNEVDNSTTIAFGVIGGAIGAGVAHAISNGKQAQKRYVYKLNLNSGKSQKVTKEALEQNLQKTLDLLEQYKTEPDPSDVPVILKYVILTNQP